MSFADGKADFFFFIFNKKENERNTSISYQNLEKKANLDSLSFLTVSKFHNFFS